MKRIVLFALAGLLSLAAVAQPRGGKNHQQGNVPPPTRYTVSFESQHGESFSVFVDGDLMNRMPQSRVLVNDVSDQTHEVVVVLKRPAEKAAVLSLRPGEPNVLVNINYDQRLEQLLLYTPSHNRGDQYAEEQPRQDRDRNRGNRQGNTTVTQQVIVQQVAPAAPPVPEPPAEPEVRVASEDEVLAMVQRMKSQSFDSDRLSLGKVIVASSNLTALQISRLAETIDFSSSQVEFLKYAYHYCVDPINYYKTTDILTFSSDKKKVLDYIATQH